MRTIEFKSVKAYGAAGGVTGEASVTVHIEGKSATVDGIRALCASAPEMLDALKRLMSGLCSESGSPYDQDLEDRITHAKWVIAKVEGQT